MLALHFFRQIELFPPSRYFGVGCVIMWCDPICFSYLFLIFMGLKWFTTSWNQKYSPQMLWEHHFRPIKMDHSQLHRRETITINKDINDMCWYQWVLDLESCYPNMLLCDSQAFIKYVIRLFVYLCNYAPLWTITIHYIKNNIAILPSSCDNKIAPYVSTGCGWLMLVVVAWYAFGNLY